MTSFTRFLLVATTLFGCDRAPEKAPPAKAGQTAVARTTATQTAGTTAPTVVVPKAPDYEDARGVVREEGGAFSVLVEGKKPICLPFEAPAEARKDGVEVRFTLYLGTDVSPTGCQQVETLISMRVTSRQRR